MSRRESASSGGNSHRAVILAEMFSSGRYSDLTIICKGARFPVHRAVVCLQSKPLAAAVDGKFKEAITGEIDLDDSEPTIVKKFLEFLYMGDYIDNRSPGMDTVTHSNTVEDANHYKALVLAMGRTELMRKAMYSSSSATPAKPTRASQQVAPAGEDGPLLLNVKLYIMADRYDVQPLKVLAKTKYEQIIGNAWNDVSFAASLKMLYDETLEADRMMKDIAVKTAGQNIKTLVDRGEFASLLKSNGEIAFDILKSSLGNSLKECPWGGIGHADWVTRNGNGYNCSHCEHNYT